MNNGTHDQARRSTKYHAVVFVSAASVLIAGGLWRNGNEHTELKTGSSDAALIEELRKEVSGLQLGLNRSELDTIQESTRRAAGLVTRSVVGIRPIGGVQTLRAIPLYGDIRDGRIAPPSSAALSPGISGMVIDPAGYVLTSGNVAGLGPRVQLVFSDGVTADAEIAASDPEEFIALLKVSSPPANMTAPDFSKASSDFSPGEWLIRHGRAPSGRDSFSLCLLESVRLSGMERPVGFLDSTAAPEVDGGPVVDMKGRLKGIYVSPAQAPAFVIPIERALLTARRLMTNSGSTPSSWLGIELQDLTEDLREYFRVQTGALVTRVSPEGPAARAGLQSGDLVYSLEETEVTSAAQLAATISETSAGTSMRFGIRRGNQTRAITIMTLPSAADQQTPRAAENQTLTLKVEDTAPPSGPVIVSAGPPGLANRVGLVSGDVIKAINGRSIRTSNDMARWLQTLPTEKPTLFQIQRGDRVFFVAIKETVRIDG